LVDDAIIVVDDDGKARRRRGSPESAAIYAYGSTASRCCRYAHHSSRRFTAGFAKSIAGEYAGGIFMVGLPLTASWLVAADFHAVP
jgi:hypothetical protein